MWHETYIVKDGGYEAVYANMPRFGLARAGEHQAISASTFAAQRRGANATHQDVRGAATAAHQDVRGVANAAHQTSGGRQRGLRTSCGPASVARGRPSGSAIKW